MRRIDEEEFYLEVYHETEDEKRMKSGRKVSLVSTISLVCACSCLIGYARSLCRENNARSRKKTTTSMETYDSEPTLPYISLAPTSSSCRSRLVVKAAAQEPC